QLRKHIGQALLCERSLANLVAAAVQAHHQPVSDQLVGAYALDGRQILDAFSLYEHRRHRQQQAQAQQCQPASVQALTANKENMKGLHHVGIRTEKYSGRNAAASPWSEPHPWCLCCETRYAHPQPGSTAPYSS